MAQHAYRPEKKVIVAAVVAVAATYGYFLIFAEFGFLKIVRAALGENPGASRSTMAVMGTAGIVSSILAAGVFAGARSRWLLAAGFAVCAGAAGLSQLAGSIRFYQGVALLIGLGTGFTTVTLASVLRRALGGLCLGRIIGWGTGLAYGCCNVPAIFDAGGTAQAGLALLAAGAGLAAALVLTFEALPETPAGFDYSGPGVTTWVLIFFALVCLDSAAFYLIQHTPALKEVTWSGSWQLATNAGMHVVAAVLAGFALDQRRLGWTIFAGAGALLAGCVLIGGEQNAFAGVLLYTAGVSIYSTALVYYPACSRRPWLAALLYAVAGWVGSAAGIGLAQNRLTLPGWCIGAAAALILPALLLRLNFHGRGPPAPG